MSPSRKSRIVETILMVALTVAVVFLLAHPDSLNSPHTGLVGSTPGYAASVSP